MIPTSKVKIFFQCFIHNKYITRPNYSFCIAPCHPTMWPCLILILSLHKRFDESIAPTNLLPRLTTSEEMPFIRSNRLDLLPSDNKENVVE